jgi:hypothetical protein
MESRPDYLLRLLLVSGATAPEAVPILLFQGLPPRTSLRPSVNYAASLMSSSKHGLGIDYLDLNQDVALHAGAIASKLTRGDYRSRRPSLPHLPHSRVATMLGQARTILNIPGG